MSLMTSTPTTEQLEEAVGMIEGLKPKGEWDTMASLGANLSSLQNFMREMDGKATEEEEALAIANAVLAAEGKEEEEARSRGGRRGRAGRGGGARLGKGAGGAGAGGGREPELPGSPELADKLNTSCAGRRSTWRRSGSLSCRCARCRSRRPRGSRRRLSLRKCSPRGEEAPKAKTQTPKAPRAAAEPATTRAFSSFRPFRGSRVFE